MVDFMFHCLAVHFKDRNKDALWVTDMYIAVFKCFRGAEVFI